MMYKEKVNAIVDLSNIVWACRYTMKPREFSPALLIHKVLDMIHNNVGKFGVDGVLIACDAPNVWRKKIYPAYKANREEDRDELYEVVKDTMIEIQEFFNTCTAIPAISVEGAEADDIVAIAVQSNPEMKHVILSGDKDFVQLINDNTRLYSPVQSIERSSDNPEFDLFLKCIRGDRGDNITSAFPRVRESKVRAVYESTDASDMVNFMNHKNKDGTIVKENFKLNKELIDLSKQPQGIRTKIEEAIADNDGSYDQNETLRFFGKHDLKTLGSKVEKFSTLFKKKYL